MKGADQCPRCGSRATVDIHAPSPKGFYASDIRACKNCQTIWEPFDPADTIDPSERLASLKEPCNNCAFRPGSPEQKDKEGWRKMIDSLKVGGQFYCHKGVPISAENKNGFAYPEDGKNPRKLRLCRGYLNWLGVHLDRKYSANPDQIGGDA